MVHLLANYFTQNVIEDIRRLNTKYFNQTTWSKYRVYHNRFEHINSRNAVFIMNEFRNRCEVIATLPKPFLNQRDIARIVSRMESPDAARKQRFLLE